METSIDNHDDPDKAIALMSTAGLLPAPRSIRCQEFLLAPVRTFAPELLGDQAGRAQLPKDDSEALEGHAAFIGNDLKSTASGVFVVRLAAASGLRRMAPDEDGDALARDHDLLGFWIADVQFRVSQFKNRVRGPP